MLAASYMKLNNLIVPGHSIGGICLGTTAGTFLDQLEPEDEITTENDTIAILNKGLITIYYTPQTELITAISCNQLFPGIYDNKLWPGMNVADVIRKSSRQTAWSGFVQIDGIEGIGLSMPEEQDDFEQLTDSLSPDFIFEELWVYNP